MQKARNNFASFFIVCFADPAFECLCEGTLTFSNICETVTNIFDLSNQTYPVYDTVRHANI